MKKLQHLLLLILCSWFLPEINAQDTIRSLIISEWRGGEVPADCYIELTNVGQDTLDLSRFLLQWVNANRTPFEWDGFQYRLPSPATGDNQYYMEGVLPPGETWLAVYSDYTYIYEDDTVLVDSIPMHRPDLYEIADEKAGNGQLFHFGNHANILYYFLDNGDSIMIDCANLTLDETQTMVNRREDVAGISEASYSHTLVRKANIVQGNMNWEVSRGISSEDSEWIPINHVGQDRISFTTARTHGEYSIDMESSLVDVDLNNSELTVPWGVYKRDSLIKLINWGPGMAWFYIEDTTSVIDSTHAIVQDGDILHVLATGNELEEAYLDITVTDPATDLASVFPTLYMNEEGIWVQPYYVTDGEPVIDTIGNVPYAARVDTLFKYLEKAPDANWEIVWKDGVERADLQNGDILKVTAEDGTTIKEYYIGVQDYMASDDIQLAAITWPDKAEFIENWKDDTIPQFSPVKTAYQILLPYGTTNIPALQANPMNINAKVETQRAISLTGSLEARTTTFTVTSESDTLTQDYAIVFLIEKDPAKIQHYIGSPFISEFVTNQRAWMSYLEIVNPGTKDLDLSEYLIVNGQDVIPANDLEGLVPELPSDEDFQYRYLSYVPGFKYHDDTTNWLIEPGILELDASVDPIVKPGDVFVMASANHNRAPQWSALGILDQLNKTWNNTVTVDRDDLGVNTKNVVACLKRSAETLYLFKIKNDSVLEGQKPVGDPNDYELVDVVGDPTLDGQWAIAGDTIVSNTRVFARRNPYIYSGVRSLVESSEGFGTLPENSDWYVETNDRIPHTLHHVDIGSHTMDVVTVHLSIVTSAVYLVSDGFSSEETIQGDLTSTTVSAFLVNIDKADTAQVLTLLSGSDGNELSEDDPVSGNDTLMVVSADGLSTTKYALIDLPLSSDAILTLADDPSPYTIEFSGSSGTISGVEYGGMLKDVVAGVLVPDLAVMNVIDGDNNLIPLQLTNYDSVKVDTKVGDNVYFEVVAQDGVTIITYKLEPAALSSEAFVISSIYNVDEAGYELSGLADGTTVDLLFWNIEVVKGAKAKVLSKLGHERVDGILYYDDVLQVVSEDGSATVTYFLTFQGESNPDANNAPEIDLAFSDTTFADPGTIMLSATATDDGLPPPAELSYLWEATGGLIAEVLIENADQLSTNASFNAKGNYILTLSVSDGALTTTADVKVFVGGVGMEPNLAPGMLIYPNPAKDRLTLELLNMPNPSSVVTIYNVTGSAVYNQKLTTVKSEIDVAAFKSGLYIIKVVSGKRSFIQRFDIH